MIGEGVGEDLVDYLSVGGFGCCGFESSHGKVFEVRILFDQILVGFINIFCHGRIADTSITGTRYLQ